MWTSILQSIKNLLANQNKKIILLAMLASASSYLYIKFIHQKFIGYISIKLHTYSTLYKKYYRPKRIYFIRHGESRGNVDKFIYTKTPDNKVEITELGHEQAKNAGLELLDLIKKVPDFNTANLKIKFFVSPFTRTIQTYQEISKILKDNNINHVFIEEPLVREQEWGYFQKSNFDEVKSERDKVGKFFYRFTDGESGADVFDRCSHFLDSLYRNMDNTNREKYDIYVIVSHGLFIRLFLMRFFRWTIDYFESTNNLKNCQIISLMKQESDHKYILEKDIF